MVSLLTQATALIKKQEKHSHEGFLAILIIYELEMCLLEACKSERKPPKQLPTSLGIRLLQNRLLEGAPFLKLMKIPKEI